MTVDTEQPRDGWDATRRRVLDRDGRTCRFCGTTDGEHREEHDTGLHVHHVVPRDDGGTDDPDNLLTVCIRCHRTLEETHSKALKELDRNSVNRAVALVRMHLAEARSECSVLWSEELPRLSNLPAIEGRDLPGCTYSPVSNDALTDREKACYILGRIRGDSHLGGSIEAAIDQTPDDEISDRVVEAYSEPGQYFLTAQDATGPEFYNGAGW